MSGVRLVILLVALAIAIFTGWLTVNVLQLQLVIGVLGGFLVFLLVALLLAFLYRAIEQ